jgi:hypothetical protein
MGGRIMAFEIYDAKNETEKKLKSPRSGIAGAVSDVAGVAARGFEGIVGAPGSIASLGTNVANYLSGDRLGTYEEHRKKHPYLPPTVSDVRQATQKLTGEELEPKSQTQEAVHNVAQKFGSGLATGVAFAPNIAMSIGGELAKQAAKSFGAPESVQMAAEIGSELFLGSKLNQKALKNIASSSYEKLNNLPEKALRLQSEVPNTKKAIDKLIRQGYMGVSTPGKEFAARKADDFAYKIREGKVSFEDLWEFKKALNNLAHEATIPSGAENYLKQIGKAVRSDINQLAKTNPQYKTLQQADEITHAFAKANDAAQLINKRINELTLADVTKAGIKSLILPAIGYGASGPGAAAVGLLGTPIKSQSKYFYNLIKSSKDAQKMYGKLVLNALRNNVDSLDKSLKGFDQALNKNSKGFEIYD